MIPAGPDRMRLRATWAWPLLVVEAALASLVAASPWLRAYHMSDAVAVLAVAAGAPVAIAVAVSTWWRRPALVSFGCSLVAADRAPPRRGQRRRAHPPAGAGSGPESSADGHAAPEHPAFAPGPCHRGDLDHRRRGRGAAEPLVADRTGAGRPGGLVRRRLLGVVGRARSRHLLRRAALRRPRRAGHDPPSAPGPGVSPTGGVSSGRCRGAGPGHRFSWAHRLCCARCLPSGHASFSAPRPHAESAPGRRRVHRRGRSDGPAARARAARPARQRRRAGPPAPDHQPHRHQPGRCRRRPARRRSAGRARPISLGPDRHHVDGLPGAHHPRRLRR